jgi:hypothetical protein
MRRTDAVMKRQHLWRIVRIFDRPSYGTDRKKSILFFGIEGLPNLRHNFDRKLGGQVSRPAPRFRNRGDNAQFTTRRAQRRTTNRHVERPGSAPKISANRSGGQRGGRENLGAAKVLSSPMGGANAKCTFAAQFSCSLQNHVHSVDYFIRPLGPVAFIITRLFVRHARAARLERSSAGPHALRLSRTLSDGSA